MKLGKLMKAHGARTGVIAGPYWVSVRWVVGLTGIVEGLAKNSFAGFDFRLRAAAFAGLAILVFQVYPALALFSGGAVTVVAAATLISMVYTAAGAVAPETGDGLWGLGFPLAALDHAFVRKPLLVGGRAMEYYGLRPSGPDIDLVADREDIARLAAFLCSDQARNISGQCIPVTAGEPAS